MPGRIEASGVPLHAGARVERRTRILIVSDHEVMRLGLRSLLEASRRVDVVADVATVAEAVGAAVEHKPALMVLAGRPCDGSGIDGCREILRRVHDARIVILHEHVDDRCVVAARRIGAVGCLSLRAGAQAVCRALRDVANGTPASLVPSTSPTGHRGSGPRDVLALTAQERRVLALVAHGKTNKEIGTALGLSAKTVKNYLSHAFEKLNVSRRAQAAVLFIRDYGGVELMTRRTV